MANIFILLLACSFLLLGHGLRIKRSENGTMVTANGNGSTLSPTTKMPISVATASTSHALNKTTSTVPSATDKEVLITSAGPADGFGKVELILDDGLPLELTRLHHGKRHLGRFDEVVMPSHQTHHRRHRGAGSSDPAAPSSAPSAPYVYYNKMISPDGKQEVKEFEILAPNMMIESVQQELNYGPDQELGALLLGRNDKPQKHRRKHKSSTSVVPPMLYMLQHLLQSANNFDTPIMETGHQIKDKDSHRSPMDESLYQFLDNAVDLALRNNHDVIEHLLNDHVELDHDNELDKDKNKRNEKVKHNDNEKELLKAKGILDIMPQPQKPRKEDELIVSCPIHHEHHANKNGELVDDDVVLVNECHFV